MDGSGVNHLNRSYQSKKAPLATTKNSYLLSRRKRCLDVLGAAGIGLVFSPVLVVVITAMAFQKGPIFFSHERIGHRGERFRCYKFRSMVPDADRILADVLANDAAARSEWERDFKLKDDPRITRLGAFLRKTSLDELPQLWNVLKGEMSLVGPRPIVREELLRYGRGARFYLYAKPGITGLWQVSGRNDLSYVRRVAIDRAYVEAANEWLDISVMLRTVRVMLQPRGSY